MLRGYLLEVDNLAEFPMLLRVQEIGFAGMVAMSTGDEFLQPRPKKASGAVQEKFRTRLSIVALPHRSQSRFQGYSKSKQLLCDFSPVRPPRIIDLDPGKHNVAQEKWKHNTAIQAKLWVKLQFQLWPDNSQ